MQLDDRRDDGKAEAEAGRFAFALVAADLRAVEAVQHRFAFGGGNAGAAVDHVDARSGFAFARSQHDAAAGRSELDRVVDEIGNCLEQQIAVGAQRRERSRKFEREGNVLVFGERRIQFVYAPQFLAQIDVAEAGAAADIFEFGNAQQRAEAVEQIVRVGDAAFDRRRARVVGRRLALQPVKLGAQARQRRAQVVGDVVGNALDLVEQVFEAIEHAVGDAREHVDLVAPVGDRQAHAEIAAHDRRDRGFDAAHAAQRSARQEEAAEQARDHGQR